MQHRIVPSAALWASAITLSALSVNAQDAGDEDLEVPVQPSPSAEQPAPVRAPPPVTAPTGTSASPPPAPAPPSAPAAPSDTRVKELEELRKRQLELEQRLRALEEAKTRAPEETAKKPAERLDGADLEVSAWTRPVPLGLVISGYVQGQYEASALSEDQAAAGRSFAELRPIFCAARATAPGPWMGTRFRVDRARWQLVPPFDCRAPSR